MIKKNYHFFTEKLFVTLHLIWMSASLLRNFSKKSFCLFPHHSVSQWWHTGVISTEVEKVLILYEGAPGFNPHRTCTPFTDPTITLKTLVTWDILGRVVEVLLVCPIPILWEQQRKSQFPSRLAQICVLCCSAGGDLRLEDLGINGNLSLMPPKRNLWGRWDLVKLILTVPGARFRDQIANLSVQLPSAILSTFLLKSLYSKCVDVLLLLYLIYSLDCHQVFSLT